MMLCMFTDADFPLLRMQRSAQVAALPQFRAVVEEAVASRQVRHFVSRLSGAFAHQLLVLDRSSHIWNDAAPRGRCSAGKAVPLLCHLSASANAGMSVAQRQPVINSSVVHEAHHVVLIACSLLQEVC